jgi:hypothetical protein
LPDSIDMYIISLQDCRSLPYFYNGQTTSKYTHFHTKNPRILTYMYSVKSQATSACTYFHPQNTRSLACGIYILSPIWNFPLNFRSVSQTHVRARYVKCVAGAWYVLRLRTEQTRHNTDDNCGYVRRITNPRRQTEVGNLASGLGDVWLHLTIRYCELYQFDECLMGFESGSFGLKW